MALDWQCESDYCLPDEVDLKWPNWMTPFFEEIWFFVDPKREHP